MGNMTQLPDGRWVPAQPLPYYRDSRPIYVKIWHTFYVFFAMLFSKDRDATEDMLDKKLDKWMVPVEPYTDEAGKWHHW